MYEKFYGFIEKPFNATPDSKFFFPSPKHIEALNSLIYAINERKGFVVITGEIGAGKTTVCRTLINKLDINTKVALITNTHLSPKELITEILEEFEIEHSGGSKQKLLSYLNQWLIRQLSDDVNVVLIIDEAQNLSFKVLEEVRMLSNLETEKEKLIQIILLGQPQLRAKLENLRLEQFRQRIALYYHINSLNKEETEEYIHHRLKLASLNGQLVNFSPEAIDLIYKNSRGIPRLINLICDSALLSGFIYETKDISKEIISEVIKERKLGYQINDNSDSEEIRNLQLQPLSHNTKLTTQNSIVSTRQKIYCCTQCQHYMNCELKWIRGTRNEEQLCCPNCQNYKQCIKKEK